MAHLVQIGKTCLLRLPCEIATRPDDLATAYFTFLFVVLLTALVMSPRRER